MRRILRSGILAASLCFVVGCSAQPVQPATTTNGGPAIAAPAESKQNAPAAAEQPQFQPKQQQPATEAERVVADARVVPATSISVGWQPTNTSISEVLVQEGQQVKAGDILAKLDTRELELTIRDAQAGVDEANASYQKLIEQPSDLKQKQQELEIQRAKAQQQQAQGSITKADIDAAQAQLDEAKASLKLVLQGATPEDIQVARANLAAEQARLTDRQHDESAQKTNAEGEMYKTANALRDRQAEYSRIKWDNLRKGSELKQSDIDAEAEAQRAVQNAEIKLDQAKVEYERAKQSEIDGINLAQSNVDAAQAKLDKLLKGATAAEIANAKASVKQAEAQLARLQGENRAGKLNEAEINVEVAQGQQDLMLASPDNSDIISAKARIERAQVELDRAKLMLERGTLRAPRAGTVAAVNLKVGETPGDGSGVVIADLSQWQLTTNNLSELSVGIIREGDPVDITFYAIPDLHLTGKVTQVRAIGASDPKADTTYTVTIVPDHIDQRMRWNMSASVSINPVHNTVANDQATPNQSASSANQPK